MGIKFNSKKAIEVLTKSIVKTICLNYGLEINASDTIASASEALIVGLTYEKRKLPLNSKLHRLVSSCVKTSLREIGLDNSKESYNAIIDTVFSLDNLYKYLISENPIELISNNIKSIISIQDNDVYDVTVQVLRLIEEEICLDLELSVLDNKIKIEEILRLLREMTDKKNEKYLDEIIHDELTREFSEIYEGAVWGDLALKDIYIGNYYSCLANNDGFLYDDLFLLIQEFAYGNFNNYIRSKGYKLNHDVKVLFIYGYQGVGKSSLISKIAYDYYNKNYLSDRKIFCTNFQRICNNNSFGIDDICNHLKTDISDLKNAVIFLDALDESNISEINCVDNINSLINSLRYYNCKLIITCRHNFINTNDIRMSFDIMLHSFTEEQAIEWIQKYKKFQPNIDINEISKVINDLSQEIKQIILIPYIFYTCVSQHIDITKITELGKLYDILFDGINAQSAITDYNKIPRYKNNEWLEFQQKITSLSIEICNAPNFTISLEKAKSIIPSIIDTPKLLTEFYLKKTGTFTYKFIHNSIAEYFVARKIFMITNDVIDTLNIHDFLNQLDLIMGNNNKINYSIFEFLSYFIRLYNSYNYSMERLKNVFFNILKNSTIYNYKIIDGHSLLTRVHSRFIAIFSIFSEYYKHFDVSEKKSNFFLSLSFEEKELFIKYTNLSDSTLNCMKYFKLDTVNLKGINLVGTKFSWHMLNKINLGSAKLQNTNFVGAYLLKSVFINADLKKSNFKNADLTESLLVNCDFRDAKLDGANFYCANLIYSDIRGATLKKANFVGAILKNCIISVEQMDYIDLDIIRTNNIRVFDDNKFLSRQEITEKYRERKPVSFMFNYTTDKTSE